MEFSRTALPFATELAGTGGVLKRQNEDFRVEEIPAYDPAGTGDHVFVTLEKSGLTTIDAINQVAAAVGVKASDVGCAGMKDRHAITRQTLSFPPPCTPEQLSALELPGLSILSATRHPHKLRTAHLKGNRFTLRLRDLTVDAEVAAQRASDIFGQLKRAPGSPNWFGEQRFGNRGDNAAIGRALIGGATDAGRLPRGRKKRLFISAFQSALFNEFLRRRIDDGLYRRVLAGDVLQKTETGGMFVCEDADLDTQRLIAAELVATGPMFGHKMRSAGQDSEAAARETALLEASELELASFKRVGKLGIGTRRRLAIDLGDTSVVPLGNDCLELAFDLPAGSYATVVMREITKAEARLE